VKLHWHIARFSATSLQKEEIAKRLAEEIIPDLFQVSNLKEKAISPCPAKSEKSSR
jgi:hypothetical protein